MSEAAPKNFGRYQVLGVLGRGSMGVVYKAKDPVIGRLLAVKSVPETLGLDTGKKQEYIKRLLQDGSLFAPFGKFDLIYSVGLLDYLQHRTAIVLTRHLAGAAAPGGQLIVANMVDHASRMLLQVHLDWALVYRTREELLDIARSAVPGAQVRILEEESGVNPFFELVHE